VARHNTHDKLSSKMSKEDFPKISIDKENDFASVKLAKGIEAKSYLKNGFVFCEDKNGKIIEIQILNLSLLSQLQTKKVS